MAELTADQIEAQAKAYLREMRSRRTEQLDPEALAWLALVPDWTEPLAEACEFPTRSLTLSDFVARAGELDLCTEVSAMSPDGTSTRRFWMPDAQRPGVLQDLRRSLGPDSLSKTVGTIARRLVEAQRQGIPVSPAVARWAELAGQALKGTGAVGTRLLERVQGLGREGETGQAAAWVNTGRALALALGGELQVTVALADRSVQLAYRKAEDQRFLEGFVERKDQIQAFRALMEGPVDRWALHYLGIGGIGKTMLMRYICAQASEEFGAPVSRIDFDYLNPGYPAYRPGQMLLELAQELRVYVNNPRQERSFRRFQQGLLYLHEILSDEPELVDPLDNLKRGEFQDSLKQFSAVLKAFDSPVVLILDTCEELSKPTMSGERLPSLSATFRILDWIHEMAPQVRVIFAGRRLLTQAGAGWQARVDQLAEENRPLLGPTPYLRLHLMRAFSRDEAHILFDMIEDKGEGRPLIPEAREAILAANADSATPARVYDPEGRPLSISSELYDRLREALLACGAFDAVEGLPFSDRHPFDAWLSQSPPVSSVQERVAVAVDLLHAKVNKQRENALVLFVHALSEEDGLQLDARQALRELAPELEEDLRRYNPFDLDLYAALFLEEPELTAASLDSRQFDPYVEMRILKRINQDDVRDLLPAVTALRRFDQEMLQPAYSGDQEAFKRAFRALSAQEWINYYRRPDPEGPLLEVDPNLHPRLLEYFEKRSPSLLREARAILAPALKARVGGDPPDIPPLPLPRLSTDLLNATLSLLPDAEAAQLWSEIEARIGVEADWDWALRTTRHILGQEYGAAGEGDSLLLAAVKATYTAANLQLSATYDPSPGWEVVEEVLGQLDPDLAGSSLGRCLSHRATLGQIAAARVTGRSPLPWLREALDGLLALRVFDLPEDLGTGPVAQALSWAAAAQAQLDWETGSLAQLQGSLMAALEALLDRAEESGEQGSPDFRILAAWAADLPDQRLRPFVHALAGRAAIQQGEAGPAFEEMERAIELAAEIEDAWRGSKPWADWRAPASLRDRLRLERLRVLPQRPPSEVLRQWLAEALEPPGRSRQIDSERLASALLRALLGWEMVPRELLERVTKDEHYMVERKPACTAHRQTPPLFVTLARGWLARGDAAQAEFLLDRSLQYATRTREDAVTVAAATRGLLEVARRMRQRDRARQLLQVQAHQGWPEYESWPVGALTGTLAPGEWPTPAPDWPARRLHAWWSSQYDLTPERIEQAASIPALADAAGTEDVSQPPHLLLETFDLRLDAYELEVLGRRQGASMPSLDSPGSVLNILTRLWEVSQFVSAEERLRLALRWIALETGTEWGPERAAVSIEERLEWWRPTVLGEEEKDRVLDRVGRRRAAEIALEEGELLALRLPDLAWPLLAQARDWFVETGDPLGATQAASLMTLAALRAGDGEAAQRGAANLATDYEALASSSLLGELPDLAKWAGTEMPSVPSLGGWTLRLATCQAALAGTGIPSQLRGAGVPELRVPELMPEPEPEPDSPPGLTDRTTNIILGVGLVLLVGFLIGLFFGFKWLLDTVFSAQLGAGASIGLFVLAWFLLSFAVMGIRGLFRWIRSLLAARMRVELTIREADPGLPQVTSQRTGEGVLVEALLDQGRRWDLRWWPLWRPVYRTQPTSARFEYEDQGDLRRAYRQAAQRIPPDLAAELEALQQLLGRRSLVLSLNVAPSLVSYPWEAMLTLALPEVRLAAGREPFQFLRRPLLRKKWTTLFRAQGVPVADRELWVGEVRAVASEVWSGSLQQGWESLHAAGTEVSVSPDLYVEKGAGPIKILHLVGNPTRTVAGMRLQLGPDSMMEYAQSDVGPAGGTLISPDELPLARTALVVLQPEPVEDLTRQDADRDDAALLRTLASEILAAGAPAVITLPALPPELAIKVLDRLGRGLRGSSPPDLKRLLDLLARVRREIVQVGCVPRPAVRPQQVAASENPQAWQQTFDRLELALDVCLFSLAGLLQRME